MKFRIIRKTARGYNPTYFFQQRSWLIWWTIRWSSSFEVVKEYAQDYVGLMQEKPSNTVLWETNL